jgi:cell cycle sensor histidine kinase DivJ
MSDPPGLPFQPERGAAATASGLSAFSLQRFGHHFPYALWVLSYADRRVLYVNREFEAIWKISAREFMADPLCANLMIHPEDRALRPSALERQIAGEKLDFEFRIVSPTGQERWVREVAFTIPNEHGQPTWICVITKDISDYKRLGNLRDESDERFQAFFDNSPEALFCADGAGIVRFRNHSSLNLNPALASGDALERIFHDEDRAAFLGALANAVSRRVVVTFDARLAPEEGARWISGRIAPLPGESGTREFIISLRDITRSKEDEATLRREHSEATTTNAQIRELDTLKNRVVAGLAHDIRSPLSAVSGALDIMRMIGVSEELSEYLELAQEGLTHATRLIGELLEVGRVEIGGDTFEPVRFDPKTAILECLAAASIDAHRRVITISSSVTVDSEPLPELLADRLKFKRILDNLLANAVKFTPNGGTVTFDARIATREKRFLELSISDTGIGIAPEDLPKIFDPYKQAETDRRHLGVGLGLAVVKHLVEAHKGTIAVTSEVSRGTTFTVTFPVV